MKSVTLLVLLLGLVIGASAQATINFANLPDVSSPTPLPTGYGGLNWNGFYYVDPAQWAGAGAGFKNPQYLAGKDVAFSPYACSGSMCYGSISSQDGKSFLITRIMAAAAYNGNPLIVRAYNHGTYVGSQNFMLTSQVQELDFPPAWGGVSQLVFEGSVVLYNVSVTLTP